MKHEPTPLSYGPMDINNLAAQMGALDARDGLPRLKLKDGEQQKYYDAGYKLAEYLVRDRAND